MDSNYMNLRWAIINRAVLDIKELKTAVINGKTPKEREGALTCLMECVDFAYSDWFARLSDDETLGAKLVCELFGVEYD